MLNKSLLNKSLSHLRKTSAMTENTHIDLNRSERCGFPEVVYCEGKSAQTIIDIFQLQHQHEQDCFGTRISPEQSEVVRAALPEVEHHSVARTIRWRQKESTTPPQGLTSKVAVISAGTTDLPVAAEAVETLKWMGCDVELIADVGVAGPHRLLEHQDQFKEAAAIVVVAGMEGALPSVVGGHVNCPVIAVPTSVGYGAAFGGIAALLGMLNSCASNVTVVNIDSGFKGGYVAGLIASRSKIV
ncbi:Circadian phase modifier [hydrothermal vent metagenome]|uniref:Circadian phase modifier n=1 Tax=hydrothermal vent metagenome TaxID=652676 RepID=A0A3B1E643_9ZZZZ